MNTSGNGTTTAGVTASTWYTNIGLTQSDLYLPAVIGVLIIMVAFGGIIGTIGWYLLIGLALVAAGTFAYQKWGT